MNIDTFEIKTEEEIKKLTENERLPYVMLNQEQDEKLRGMNREERRRYFKKHKKEFKGKSWEEVNGIKEVS